MVEVRIEVSDDVKRKMAELPLDWSAIIAAFIQDKVSQWAKFHLIVSKSKLTEKDALELGRKIKRGRAEKLKKRGFL